MKKLFLQITGAILVWFAVFVILLRFTGDGLTLYFEVPPGATGMEIVFEPDNIIRVAEYEISEDGSEAAIHFQAVQQGRTSVSLIWENVEPDSLYDDVLEMDMHSLPFGFISDSLTWNFTGWEYLTVCLSLLFLSISIILVKASIQERKRRHFSYRATSELGLAVFFLLTSFFRADMLLEFAQGKNAGTVWSLLVRTIVSAQTFMRWTAVAIAVFALLIAASNLVLIRFEGFRTSNMLGILVAAVMVGGAVFGIWMSYSLITFPLRNILVNVYAGIFVYMECLLTATIISSVLAGKHEPDYDRDYVIIFGCKIRPDGSLYPLIRGRVDRAIAFYRNQYETAQKAPILVPSGGKGADEPEPEAEAMARYMREQGIPEEHIIIENRSTTTLENIAFSRELISKLGDEDKTAFCTSNYHVYRGGIIAAETGWEIDGMGSITKWYYWPNAFLREFIGLLATTKMQQAAAVLIIAVLSGALTVLLM